MACGLGYNLKVSPCRFTCVSRHGLSHTAASQGPRRRRRDGPPVVHVGVEGRRLALAELGVAAFFLIGVERSVSGDIAPGSCWRRA
jgi:hypothetical protein